MGTLIEHKSFDIKIELPEITQGTLEEYETILAKTIGPLENIEITKLQGNIVRAAAQVEWLNGIAIDDVVNMKPSLVVWLSNKITEHINNAKKVPEE